MPLPLISVVMPTLNQRDYVDEAIGSVLGQEYPRKELIVMDGGSTDGTADVVARHADRLSHWESGPDRGQSDAINRGVAHARGEILTWLSSDDVLLPGALASVAQAWERSGAAPWIAGNCLWVGPQGRVVRCARGTTWSSLLARLGQVNVAGPSSFFTRELFREAGGLDLDLHYMMDTDLWLRFASHGRRFLRVQRYLWALRLHPRAKMSGHHFESSEMARPDHPCWGQRRLEARIIRSRHGGSPAMTRIASRCLRLLTGTTPRAWVDWLHLRGRHWSRCPA